MRMRFANRKSKIKIENRKWKSESEIENPQYFRDADDGAEHSCYRSDAYRPSSLSEMRSVPVAGLVFGLSPFGLRSPAIVLRRDHHFVHRRITSNDATTTDRRPRGAAHVAGVVCATCLPRGMLPWLATSACYVRTVFA